MPTMVPHVEGEHQLVACGRVEGDVLVAAGELEGVATADTASMAHESP
jgi:hypothetical protein